MRKTSGPQRTVPAQEFENAIRYRRQYHHAGLAQIHHAQAHPRQLVQAVKSYSFMDQAPGESMSTRIENTLIILGHKRRTLS
jgi:hypothetical protein